MSVSQLAIAPDSFLRSLQAISEELRVPWSPRLLQQRFPPPYDLATVRAAARAIGASAELDRVSLREMPAQNALCFALLRSPMGSDTQASAGAPADPRCTLHRLMRVERLDDRTVVVREAGANPVSLPLEGFRTLYTGYALRAEREPTSPASRAQEEMPRRDFGLAWFGREMLRYPGIWRDVLLASLFLQLAALLVPLLTQVVIDKVITHRTLNTLLVVAGALLLATLFSAALSWVRQYLVLHTGTRIDAVLAAEVFEHLLRLPARYFQHRPTGVLVARLHAVEPVRDFIAGAALTLVIDLPFALLFLFVMLHYSPTLTAIALAVLALLAIVSLAMTPLLRRRIDRQFLAGARQQAFVTEYLAGIETVKSLQLEGRLQQRFESLFADYLHAGFAARRLHATLQTLAHALEQGLALAILCVGAWLVIEGAGLTIGGLVAMQMFAARLTAPVLRLVGLWQEFQQIDVAIRRLGDIMNVPPEPIRLAPARAADGPGRLEVTSLGFRHEGRTWLFRDLSFVVEPGDCVALIGPSGSGKSTLSRLLQGFHQAEEGRICVDGVDVAHMAANELRSYFGVVPQETRLFSGTLLENLLDANPAAGFDDAVQACKAASVHDFIESLPEGYFTPVGEMGVGLSGGQRQRLAIARALLKRPRILVLDEATASLDAPLAAGVIETVNALRGKVSLLFIVHERPPGLHCDAVVDLAALAERRHG